MPEESSNTPGGKSPRPDPPSSGQDTIARRLRIHGRVQGVWYRGSATAAATRLGLSGWVRNRNDGTVEALAIGPLAAVEAFIAWAHRGPSNARVSRVEVFEAEIEQLADFDQRPTV
jgi:acylphosphatase